MLKRLAAIVLALASPALAQSPADFFRARPLTIHVGYGPGGGYDLYCRLVAAHLSKHLPGNPTIIVRNEPGAGSLRLANDLYSRLPRDGADIGMFGEVLVISQRLGDPAAKFEARDFNWIGRISDSDPVMVTRADSGIATMKDAMTKELIVGVPGAGSATGLLLGVLNSLTGAKLRQVTGYDGSAQVRLALERGEVQASSSTLWSVDKAWVRQNRFNVLYQVSPDKAADLADIPSLVDLARAPDERKLLEFFSSYVTVGRSLVAPPGVPADRVEFLRAALNAALADPALVADARRQNLPLAPMTGAELAARVISATNLDQNLLARAKALRDVRRLRAMRRRAGKPESG